jgi:hypothetical protein
MNVERVIKFELSRLNVHLPQQRISLRDALAAEKPQVVTKDGSVHVFKREELELLAGIVPEADRDRLQLPIYVTLNPKLGRGAAQIVGEIEVKVIANILQKECAGDELLIYRPELAAVRRRLPTTTQYFFMVG